MKEMVLMTREEFEAMQNKIRVAEHEANDVVWRLTASVEFCKEQRERADNLWQMLNRPAIEAAAQKHEDEFLDWCEEKSAEYERKEFDDWCLQKAKSYNNGRKTWCKIHRVPEEDYEQQIKYKDLLCERPWTETEGWSELNHTDIYADNHWLHTCNFSDKDNTWILPAAREDAWNRYLEHKNVTGSTREKYWKLVETFIDMRHEGYSVDQDFGGYYR